MINGGCGAVVLAAGEARRFGSPKLLMPFGGSTIVGSVIDTLSRAGVAPIIVVTSANAAVSEALEGQPIRIINNSNWTAGMISSVRVGVDALPSSLDRFFIALGDQPRIHPKGISHLIEEQIKSGKGIAIPTYQGKRGHPVAFNICYRAGILAFTEQQTLRDLIDTHGDDIAEIECDSDAYINDIDTREEYECELQRWRDER